ncbi:MAG: hypothetical protein ACI4CT_05205 [Lachnospiraceae bacterium]
MATYSNHTYVHGSTARQMEAEQKRSTVKAQAKRNRERAVSINIVDSIFIVAALACVLFACLFYLSAQSKMNACMNSVQSKEKTLQKLVDENNSTVERLNSSLDVEAIYEKATKELGMKYASSDQVVYYKSTSPDYVVQYKNIPDGE